MAWPLIIIPQNYFLANKKQIKRLVPGDEVVLQVSDWFAVSLRFDVLAMQAPGTRIQINDSGVVIKSQASDRPTLIEVQKPELSSIAPELDKIRYEHLWRPLGWLARLFESLFVFIRNNILITGGGLSLSFLSY